ncbi:MAG: GFA family protein [Saccharospirillaceae bacterium]|nr:GFA family protein [Pseudomonadales bacterium]NRB79101.1 GFA family protein [Saccharospirillaceae bacterium]
MNKLLTCHCGAVEMDVLLDGGELKNIRRCACSLCSRKGYIMASVPIDNLKVTKGVESLSVYKWGTQSAAHYFCNQCGVYTHHKRKSNPNELGINIACFDFVDVDTIKDIPYGNGDICLMV